MSKRSLQRLNGVEAVYDAVDTTSPGNEVVCAVMWPAFAHSHIQETDGGLQALLSTPKQTPNKRVSVTKTMQIYFAFVSNRRGYPKTPAQLYVF